MSRQMGDRCQVRNKVAALILLPVLIFVGTTNLNMLFKFQPYDFLDETSFLPALDKKDSLLTLKNSSVHKPQGAANISQRLDTHASDRNQSLTSNHSSVPQVNKEQKTENISQLLDTPTSNRNSALTQKNSSAHKAEDATIISQQLDTPSPNEKLSLTPKNSSAQPQRELTFDDLTLGDFVAEGGVNIVYDVTLPEWAYKTNKKPRLLLKMCTDPSDIDREATALERMNRDEKLARRIKVLPLYYANRDMANPWYCSSSKKRKGECKALPKSFPERSIGWLQRGKRLGVLVIPFQPEDYIEDHMDTVTMKDIQRFVRSLLQQLAHAHKLGVTNFDLNLHRNIYMDQDGDAILFDWNGNMRIGEPIYDRTGNVGILPPEAWFETTWGYELLISVLHAVDVWEVGILLIRLVYYPCTFPREEYYSDPLERLREVILTFKGNTRIPVGNEDGDMVDLADVAELDKNAKVEPEPLLWENSRHRCRRKSFVNLERETTETQEHVVDLIKSILRIAPQDRPDCDTVLQHPFFKLELE